MEKLDIRTHLIVLISATLFWFVFQSNAEIHGLVVLCALYMCVAGYWEKAPGFIMTYIIMLLLGYLHICTCYTADDGGCTDSVCKSEPHDV